ncbi:MAG: SprT family zinc-dependent metalloprotease [Chloroflexota bacterium]
MNTQITLGDITADVRHKEIKNIHLSVYPPDGDVRISAPMHMPLETIRLFAITKLDWIKRQRRKFQTQEREPPRDYLERESHYLWGKRYLLHIVESNHPASVELHPTAIVMHVRTGADTEKRHALMDAWYRAQLHEAIPPLIAKWELLMNVNVARFFVRRMKTKWGSCNPQAHTIRLNTELAKKPPIYLEYIVAHEMTHLIEPTHNARFVALMDRFMPQWKQYRAQLNALPIGE